VITARHGLEPNVTALANMRPFVTSVVSVIQFNKRNTEYDVACLLEQKLFRKLTSGELHSTWRGMNHKPHKNGATSCSQVKAEANECCNMYATHLSILGYLEST
jgi:hypothetical protein